MYLQNSAIFRDVQTKSDKVMCFMLLQINVHLYMFTFNGMITNICQTYGYVQVLLEL